MSRYLTTLPINDGFRMPAEWESHKGCWLIWPERTDFWYNGGKPAQKQMVEVATEISKFESVTVAVSTSQYAHARARLPEKIKVVELSTNDAWVRDTGATCLINDETGEVRGIDWKFNAWGEIYFPWDLDDAVARKMCEIEGIDCYNAPFILEGGSIHVDGEGTILTTEQCLLNDNRNPHLNKQDLEQLLCNYLNGKKVVWLPMGWTSDDDTNGHIDNLAMFVAPGVIALNWTLDENDPMFPICQAALTTLEAETDAKGRKFQVIKVPMPTLYYTKEQIEGLDSHDGTYERTDKCPASYINCYLANGAAIVPIFNCPTDEEALIILQNAMPDKKVVGLPATDLVCGGGDIHCLTQQIPCVN